ncbi:MAG TPA: hypothetical protein VFG45_04550, partial [Candidatus Nitrosocosmicus sp.]|nr:hypothetical protein [Candidatus Nitrosocosmicus sp.]
MEQLANERIDPMLVGPSDSTNIVKPKQVKSKNTLFLKFDYAIASHETRSYYHRKTNAFLVYIDL